MQSIDGKDIGVLYDYINWQSLF